MVGLSGRGVGVRFPEDLESNEVARRLGGGNNVSEGSPSLNAPREALGEGILRVFEGLK
jgi:hypothetical protein